MPTSFRFLDPADAIEVANARTEGNRLLADNGDPQVIVKLAHPLTEGWWRFEVTMESDDIRNPQLMVDFGAGFNQVDMTPLQRIGRTDRYEAIFYSPGEAHHLRFDPTDQPGMVTVGKSRLRRFSKAQVAMRLSGKVWGVLKRDRTSFLAKLPHYIAYVRTKRFKRLQTATASAPQGIGYTSWLALNDYREDLHGEKARQMVDAFASKPLISIVTPIYETPRPLFEALFASIRAQVYPHWEWCLADDASKRPHVRRMLEEAAASDPRIKLVFREKNGHISQASNSALALATGEMVTLVDHDDLVHPLALFHLAKATNTHPQWRILYSDEDKADHQGRRFDPYFKGAFNRDLFYGHNMMTHLIAYRRSDLAKIGGFRLGLEGSQDYDLALRVLELVRDEREEVIHIPHVLYHWRAIEGSIALGAGEKSYAHDRARTAINEHFERIGLPAKALPSPTGSTHEVVHQAGTELMSIVICTRDRVDLLRPCIDSILRLTSDRNFEIIIVDNGSDKPETAEYLASLSAAHDMISIVRDDGPFNYSRINNLGVRHSRGQYLCLLNNDTEVIAPEWLSMLRMHLDRPGVGVAGAKLLYTDGTIQHAGVGTGLGGLAAHPYGRELAETTMNVGKAQLTQAVSAVTGACLATSRALWDEIGGLDETRFAIAYNDVDYCLECWKHGKSVIYEPRALLYHHESVSRGSDEDPSRIDRFNREKQAMHDKWGQRLLHDPFINPNFSLDTADFRLRPDAPSILD